MSTAACWSSAESQIVSVLESANLTTALELRYGGVVYWAIVRTVIALFSASQRRPTVEWVAVLLVSMFAVLGSIYCVLSISAAWKEARSAREQSGTFAGDSAKGTRVLTNLAVLGVELGLAAVFVVGAVFVAFHTAQNQGAAWWQASEAKDRCENCLAERFFAGPNGSRLVVHFADSLPNRPVVFVDSTSQPIGDGDLAELADQFPEVRDLLLGRTQLTDAGLSELRRFRHLESLSLQRIPITDQGLRQLAVPRDLTFLDLSSTNISDQGLKSLAAFPKLEELRLCDTRISDAGLAHLRQHRNLRLLALTQTAVTEQGIARLQRALPTCTIEEKTASARQTAQVCTVDRR